MGVYGPYTQVKCLVKALIFLTCKQNIIIYSQSAVSVTSLDSYRPSKWQNVLDLCGQFRDFKVTLKLKLQT